MLPDRRRRSDAAGELLGQLGVRGSAPACAPFGNWGYDQFITGANDKSGHFVQFAPKLVSNGGNWDLDAMAQLIVDSGAWFAGPVAEHHDGFSMWDSKANAWNSAAKGPILNMAAIHAQAFRKKRTSSHMHGPAVDRQRR